MLPIIHPTIGHRYQLVGIFTFNVVTMMSVSHYRSHCVCWMIWFGSQYCLAVGSDESGAVGLSHTFGLLFALFAYLSCF
jgi:hypothetical protein